MPVKTETQTIQHTRLRHPRAWWITGWLMVAVVITGSLMPAPGSMQLTVLDKVAHAVTYALLMWWFVQLKPGRLLLIAVSLALLGILIEGLQGFQRGRVPDPLDILANLLGLAVGGICARFWCQNALSRLESRLIKDE